jgi:hypothetical protein
MKNFGELKVWQKDPPLVFKKLTADSLLLTA